MIGTLGAVDNELVSAGHVAISAIERFGGQQRNRHVRMRADTGTQPMSGRNLAF
jgi:hypothetical protein